MMLGAFVVGVRRIGVSPSVAAFGPFFPARMIHEVSRTEELAERRRAHSVDYAGLEVVEHRAWYVRVA